MLNDVVFLRSKLEVLSSLSVSTTNLKSVDRITMCMEAFSLTRFWGTLLDAGILFDKPINVRSFSLEGKGSVGVNC